MYSAKHYIEWYESLTNNSEEANAKLMDLEMSEDSWLIAQDLMADQQYHLHGSQLLSKKLNQPITFQDEKLRQLQTFILSFSHLNDTLYYCLAKIHLHLARTQLKLQPPSHQPLCAIKILSSLPQAMISIRVIHSFGLREATQQTFQHHQQLLVQYFNEYTQQVLGCIDNYATNNIKLNSVELMRLILTQPIEKTSVILEEVLLREKYPSLNEDIISYFNRIKMEQHLEVVFPPYIAFCRSLQLLNLSHEFLHLTLERIIAIMKMGLTDDDTHYITETFEFWSDLSALMGENHNHPKLCYDGFVEVWKIVIQKSIYKQLPALSKEESPLEFNHDGEAEVKTEGPANLKFRNLSEDFIILAFRTLLPSAEYTKTVLGLVYQLIQSHNLQQVELAIFVIEIVEGIVPDYDKQNLSYVSELLVNCIEGEYHRQHPLIGRELLKVIGQSTNLMHETAPLTMSLKVISSSLQHELLCNLATDTLNNLINEVGRNGLQLLQASELEGFLNQVYETTFLNTKNEKLFLNLTKALTNFIYKFKKNTQIFKNFLIQYQSRINSLQEKCKCLQALVSSHIGVASEYSQHFTNLLSQFLIQYKHQILQSLEKATNKKELNQALISLKVIIVGVGGHYSCEWVPLIMKVFGLGDQPWIISSGVLIVVKMLQITDRDKHYNQTILQLLEEITPKLTDQLEYIGQQDYDLIKNILLLNLTIMNNFLGMYAFNPDKLFHFIYGSILMNQSFWQFETIRTALAILLNFTKKNYQLGKILFGVLRAYGRYRNSFSKSIEGILFESYRQGGMEPFYECLKEIRPELVSPNPLWESLERGLKQCQGKTVKNILLCLN